VERLGIGARGALPPARDGNELAVIFVWVQRLILTVRLIHAIAPTGRRVEAMAALGGVTLGDALCAFRCLFVGVWDKNTWVHG
jgi:hypothetical protein